MTLRKAPTTKPACIKTLPTDDQMAALLQEAAAVDAENQEAWSDLRIRWMNLRRDLAEFIGYNSYLRPANDRLKVWMSKGPLEAATCTGSLRPWVTQYQDRFASLKAQAERDAQVKKDEEAKRHQALKPARAVLFLLKHGKVQGQDFTADSAVYEANCLAYDLALAAKKAGGGPYSFSGEDDCENCSGWDGESHRCECGNRRVDWVADGDFDDYEAGTYIIYAEAY